MEVLIGMFGDAPTQLRPALSDPYNASPYAPTCSGHCILVPPRAAGRFGEAHIAG